MPLKHRTVCTVGQLLYIVVTGIITVDWWLLGNLRAREGGAVKFFQIRQALASARMCYFVEGRRRGRMSCRGVARGGAHGVRAPPLLPKIVQEEYLGIQLSTPPPSPVRFHILTPV